MDKFCAMNPTGNLRNMGFLDLGNGIGELIIWRLCMVQFVGIGFGSVNLSITFRVAFIGVKQGFWTSEMVLVSWDG